MRNKKLIPFEVIQKAVAGEPEAVDAVLQYCGITPRTSNTCLSIRGISMTIHRTS